MSRKAMILKKLYDAGRVTGIGLKNSVVDCVITAEEYEAITETPYMPPEEQATASDYINALAQLGVSV